MRKRLILVGMVALVLPFVGCGIPQSKYNTLLDEMRDLRGEYGSLLEESNVLQREYADLLEQVDLLTEEIDAKDVAIGGLERKIDELQEKLDLYKETGISVYTIKDLPLVYNGSGSVSLWNSDVAVNPSYDALLEFLESDRTDQEPYSSLYRLCGWFAEQVHNNAEDSDIKCAFVIVNFSGQEPSHALNAFYTTDKGLVFIDCTGGEVDFSGMMTIPMPQFGWEYCRYSIGDTGVMDTVAFIEVGKQIGFIQAGLNYGLEYSEHSRWKGDVRDMTMRFNRASTCSQLASVKEESDVKLGSFFQSGGVVESIEVYW